MQRLRSMALAASVLIAAAGGLIAAAGCDPLSARSTAPSTPSAEPTATIRGTEVILEVVTTRQEQARGLGYRDSLDWGRGMLFPYDPPAFPGFWMKGMRFDIDIVWIREGRIVDLSHRVPHVPSPKGPWPSVRPGSLIDRVLEVPAGFVQSHGWRIGDRVDFARLPFARLPDGD